MTKNKISYWSFEGKREEYQEACIQQIIDRAEKLLSKGYIKSAISCYEGSMNRYWDSQEIQSRLGKLHLETGDQVKAGRYFYFKENPAESELICIRLFEESFGNDPVLILKRLLNKERRPVSKLDLFTKQKLNELINEAVIQKGVVPAFLGGMKRHFEKIGLE